MAWKNVQYENGKMRTSSGGSGGASNFADLEDVDLSNLQDGQVPKYNATTGKWENANESGGSTNTYSTTEQVVGTWIDGKPLYQKTWDFSSSPKTLTKNAWTRTGISNTGIASVIDVFAVNDVGDGFRMLAVSKGSYDDIEILNSLTTRDISASYITLQYTKTTD